MSMSRNRAGALAWSSLAALAVMLVAIALSASGCGEKSLPAATQRLDIPAAPAAKSSVAEKTAAVAPAPVAARPQPIRNITFDTVKLNVEKGAPFHSDLLTPTVKKLDGNRVRIRGFILPPPQQNGLTRFVLVRDNMACCFGPGAAIYDSMTIQMKDGLSMDYTVQPIMVEGTFNVHEVYMPNGRCISIYHVTADKAQ